LVGGKLPDGVGLFGAAHAMASALLEKHCAPKIDLHVASSIKKYSFLPAPGQHQHILQLANASASVLNSCPPCAAHCCAFAGKA
jgi:hypothetical protein